MKLAFKIQYKGTNYSGFQSQKNANSIQDELIRAFKGISADNVQMNYSGRTDKGVHALGQVFDVVVSQDRSDMQWINGLNSNLPNDISVVDLERVEDSFHSRFDAKKRTYKYFIVNRKNFLVLDKNRAWLVKKKLNINNMRKAIKLFSGTHNFNAFRSSSCSAKSPIRTIEKSSIIKKGNKIITKPNK